MLLFSSPMDVGAEHVLVTAVHWIKLAIEAGGISIVAVGAVVAVSTLMKEFCQDRKADFNRTRLRFGRYLALALEFQLAADILSTTIAPGWNEIGKLAAVAVIRTLLNYFLQKEIEMEKRAVQGETAQTQSD